MGEARILQDRSLLKESICKMDCLFLPAEIMLGFGAVFLPSDADLQPGPRSRELCAPPANRNCRHMVNPPLCCFASVSLLSTTPFSLRRQLFCSFGQLIGPGADTCSCKITSCLPVCCKCPVEDGEFSGKKILHSLMEIPFTSALRCSVAPPTRSSHWLPSPPAFT